MICAQCDSEIKEDQPYFEIVLYDKHHSEVDKVLLGSSGCLARYVIVQSLAHSMLDAYIEEHRN